MHRRFIALVVTATLVITGATASSARADDYDAARIIAGIAALAIIGKAINDRNDRKDTVQQHIYRAQPQPHLTPRPLPGRVSRKVLPAQCVQIVDTPNRAVRVLGARCLERNYRHANALPRQCARQVQTNRGLRWAYGAPCLRRNGYQIAAR